MEQFILDKQGNLIEVVNLELAIKQVKAYIGYTNADKGCCSKQAFEERQTYWADIYRKLMQLAEKKERDNPTRPSTNDIP